MSRSNLLSLFSQFGRLASDIAVVETRGYRRKKRTYADLQAHALSWSQALAARGIQPGNRVLLWGANSFNWMACFWAVLLRRGVAVPMDAGATLDFVKRVVHDADVKLLLRDTSRPPLPNGPTSLDYNDPEEALPTADASPGYENQPGNSAVRTDIAEILFTSGTTSEPRGVVLTHGNFLANLEPLDEQMEPYRKYERFVHPLRYVSTVPLSHVFGQFMALFVPCLLGATVVFENSALPSEILRSIKSERATVLVAVPRMLDALRNTLEREIDAKGWRQWFTVAYAKAKTENFAACIWRFRRFHWRLGWKFWAFICGGASLSPETEEFFKRLGFAVVQGYGMTETASLISVNHPFRAVEGSVGQLLPGREFRLAEDGEILVRGENVVSGYWEKGALRPAGDGDRGWLRTGDLGELDAGGNLRFRGRKKTVIVTPAGLNVYPEDLEAVLRKQPAIRDAVVVPLAMKGNAEPCAVLLLSKPVIPSEARNPSPSNVDNPVQAAIDSANSSLADYQRIRRWVLWPEPDFPRTPTGKPRLAAIASRASELLASPTGGLECSTISTSSNSLTSLPPNLKDLSSLDRLELLSSLEHRYNVELNETQFANAETSAEIEQMLIQPPARRSDYVYPRWTQTAPVRLSRVFLYYLLAWPATVLLGHPRIRGGEHLAKLREPALFIANHTTRKADIGMALYALPPRFRHHLAALMAAEILEEFRRPPREWFFAKRWLWQTAYFLLIWLFNVFPLPQFSGFRESFRFAGETVDRGYSLLVFPEGEVNVRDSPDMIRFQPGIGLLAQNLRIPVVPMRFDGLWHMTQEHRRLARAGEITIHIGAPVTFPPDTPPAEIASRLHELVRSL
jgi:long-chain acyl-CoA synthetase